MASCVRARGEKSAVLQKPFQGSRYHHNSGPATDVVSTARILLCDKLHCVKTRGNKTRHSCERKPSQPCDDRLNEYHLARTRIAAIGAANVSIQGQAVFRPGTNLPILLTVGSFSGGRASWKIRGTEKKEHRLIRAENMQHSRQMKPSRSGGGLTALTVPGRGPGTGTNRRGPLQGGQALGGRQWTTVPRRGLWEDGAQGSRGLKQR